MTLRAATRADLPALNELIQRSVRELSAGHYSPAQIDSSLKHVFGVDTQLIADATYFVIEEGSTIVAAGGWSKRATLYGGDQAKPNEDPLLDPARDPARIRAFFVQPEFTRRGLARQLYDACAAAARAHGFQSLELGATLPGVPLYKALGFAELERIEHPMPDGEALPLIRMRRTLA